MVGLRGISVVVTRHGDGAHNWTGTGDGRRTGRRKERSVVGVDQQLLELLLEGSDTQALGPLSRLDDRRF